MPAKGPWHQRRTSAGVDLHTGNFFYFIFFNFGEILRRSLNVKPSAASVAPLSSVCKKIKLTGFTDVFPSVKGAIRLPVILH